MIGLKDNELVFGICFYNDPSIFRLLDSLPERFTKIMVDGKFKFNENPKELSDETIRDRIRRYTNVVLVDAPNLMENHKRDQYLIKATELKADFLFIIDSDEFILSADWDLFCNNVDKIDKTIPKIYGVSFEYDQTSNTRYPRLWVRPNMIRYWETHNIFNVNGNLIKSSGQTELIQGITVSMDDSLRDKKYLNDTYEYQKKMIQYEKPYRHSLR